VLGQSTLTVPPWISNGKQSNQPKDELQNTYLRRKTKNALEEHEIKAASNEACNIFFEKSEIRKKHEEELKKKKR